MNGTKNPQVIVLASGKGGTGKSTLSINISMALADLGKRVVILDANLELPSIATLLNISPPYTITDLIEGHRSIREVIYNGPKGINLILGSSLPKTMRNLSHAHHFGIVNALNAISKELDILIIDTAPGINKSTLDFIRASQEVLLITNSEPTSLASTNALIQILSIDYGIQHFRILINRAYDEHEGLRAFNAIQKPNANNTDLFLNYSGYIHDHKSARIAASKGQALYEMLPKSEFAQDMKRLAKKIETWPIREIATGEIEFFMEEIIQKTITGKLTESFMPPEPTTQQL